MKNSSMYRGNLVGNVRWADAGSRVAELERIVDRLQGEWEEARSKYVIAAEKRGATFSSTQSLYNAMTGAKAKYERAQTDLAIERAKSR